MDIKNLSVFSLFSLLAACNDVGNREIPLSRGEPTATASTTIDEEQPSEPTYVKMEGEDVFSVDGQRYSYDGLVEFFKTLDTIEYKRVIIETKSDEHFEIAFDLVAKLEGLGFGKVYVVKI
jgi:biopolymer transport protein ExbD